jgi:hypothetical protein
MQVVVGDEGLERLGSGGEAAGHRDAEPGQLADHLAERGILAAHLGEVGQAQVVQPQDVVQVRCSMAFAGALGRSSGGDAARPRRQAAILQPSPRTLATNAMDHARPVFYVSDGTGITAETIGHSLLTQFSGMRFRPTGCRSWTPPRRRARPRRIRAAGEASGLRPIVVNSCVDPGL